MFIFVFAAEGNAERVFAAVADNRRLTIFKELKLNMVAYKTYQKVSMKMFSLRPAD